MECAPAEGNSTQRLGLVFFGAVFWGDAFGRRQNRLGFVVDVAEDVAKRPGDGSRKWELSEIKAVIELSRLVREDTFAADLMNEAQRKSLRRARSAKARHWNLPTDIEAKHLAYVKE